MKVLYFLKINKKNSKKENLGITVWQLLLIIVFSGIISYLILLTQHNQMTPIDCGEKDENKQRWVKCSEENINQEKNQNIENLRK
ncbi:MAG: hypothetical protein QNJ42_01995 [Crocosphaera sp.]|nr:hypothetical protein [Crocosphaera sp.]